MKLPARKVRVIAIVSPLLMAFAATPATASEEDAQVWLTATGTTAIDDNDRIQLDVIERFRSDATGGDQVIGRLTENHELGRGVSIGGGAAIFRTHGIEEYRTHQVLDLAHGWLSSRTTAEQRYGQLLDRVGLRLRERVQVAVPIGHHGWRAFANVEAFFALNHATNTARTGFDVLRAATGVRFPLLAHVSGTISYYYQRQFRIGAADRVSHIPALSLAISF